MQIKETQYKGITFRSRLEARWAVFFDELGLRWEYEPEGYQLNNRVGYLPDFFVHGISGEVGDDNRKKDGVYIEVKGDLQIYDRVKLEGFEYPIYVVGNVPDSTKVWDDVFYEYRKAPNYMFSEQTIDGKMRPIWFAECEDGIKLLGIEDKAKVKFRNWCERACTTARNAKFEKWNEEISKSLHEPREIDYTRNPLAQQPDESDEDYSNRMKKEREEEKRHQEDNYRAKQQVEEEKRVRREASQKRRRELEMQLIEKEREEWRKEMQKQEEELENRRIEAFRSIHRIPLNQVIEMYLDMPGIKEYGFEKAAHCIRIEDVPDEAIFKTRRENHTFIIGYTCCIMREGFYYQLTGDILSFDENLLCGDLDLDNAIRVLCEAIDMMRKEIIYIGNADSSTLDKWKEEKEKKRAQIIEDIEQRKRYNDEYEALYKEYNPYIFGEYVKCFKEVVSEMRENLKYADTLFAISLNEVNENDRFGTDRVILMINKENDNDSWVHTTNRSYYFATSNGKTHFMSDTRNWFRFLQKEDTLDKSVPDYILAIGLSEEFRRVVSEAAKRYQENMMK